MAEGFASEPRHRAGDDRLLACLYAYGDKLSGQCEFALYDAAVRLEWPIDAIAYVASECRTEPLGHGPRLQGPPRRVQPAAVFKGDEEEGPRREFLYRTDDDLAALRYGQWKLHFLEQRAHGEGPGG